MGVAEVVQWWEHWQLRILALGSLSLQFFLFAAAGLRKRRIPAWLRVGIWLAYLGSDAVAIYGLATLFNHQRKRDWVPTASKNTPLQALWAPVLLLHIGGQDAISAFSIEDNELWKRYVLTAASQITVASYVFWKSLPEDMRLFEATILFFVPAVLKCLEKPLALKSASIHSMSAWASSAMRKIEESSASYSSLDAYVKEAVKYFGSHEKKQEEAPKGISPYKLFVDQSYPFGVRLENLKYMSWQRSDELRQHLYDGLFNTFDFLYTKRQLVYTTIHWPLLGPVVRVVPVILQLAATVLFHTRRRRRIGHGDDTGDAEGAEDVIITYVLLWGTLSMELVSGWRRVKQALLLRHNQKPRTAKPAQVAQCNLIWYLSCRIHRKRSSLRSRCKHRLQLLRGMDPCSDEGITELVHGHITRGWERDITDAETYREFNDKRGQLAVRRFRAPQPHHESSAACASGAGALSPLEASLRRPFDESVLIWHLATDFCFHSPPSQRPSMEDEGTATRCRRISNYMLYLLYRQPEMLIPGARVDLFGAAYQALKLIMAGDGDRDGQAVPRGKWEKHLAQRIMHKMLKDHNDDDNNDDDHHHHQQQQQCTRDNSNSNNNGLSLVRDACVLAQELLKAPEGKKTMWELIQGVWVEMLCFSAGRTRGYLHAKALGKGGQYLSYVWLLQWYMGMETFAVRLQRTGKPAEEQGDMSALVLQDPKKDKEPGNTTKPRDRADV